MAHMKDLLINGIYIGSRPKSHHKCTGEKDSDNTDRQKRRVHLCRHFWFKVSESANDSVNKKHIPIPKPCSENLKPPAKKHMPSTSTGWQSDINGAAGDGTTQGLHKLLRIDPTTNKSRESGYMQPTGRRLLLTG